MPDIFLRPGEANPNDVRLRDPLSFEQQAGAFDILGGASVPAPTVNQQAGAFPVLGLATAVAPLIAAGNVNVAPPMQSGGATYSTASLAYNQAIPYDGGATLLAPSAAITFRVQPGVLGTATLSAPTISLGIAPAVLGGATLPAPTIQQAISAPGVLGGAANPAPVISIGTPSTVAPPALSGGTTYSSSGLTYNGGSDYDGGAALLALSLSIAALAVHPGLLGGATNPSPQVNQSVSVPALGPATVLDPSIQQAVSAPGVLGGATIPPPSIEQNVTVEILGGASLLDPQVNQSVSVDALGSTDVPAPIISQAVGAFDVLGGASNPDPTISVVAPNQTVSPDVLGGATPHAPTVSTFVPTPPTTGGGFIRVRRIRGRIIKPAPQLVELPALGAMRVLAPLVSAEENEEWVILDDLLVLV